MRAALFALGQLACAAGVVVALYYLIGLWLTVLVTCGLAGVGLVALEYVAAPPPPRPAPRRADVVTEIPGAPRSRPADVEG
jgi:hypothetical protein